METALVYMVAGLSSRFGFKPKSFALVNNNQTLIEYSLSQALKSGFTSIIFIVSKKTESLFREKFKSSYHNVPVYYALQDYDESSRDRPWGTADAVCSINHLVDCPFVVCNGDDIYGEKSFKILFEHLQKSHESATLGYKLKKVLPESGITNRGIFKINKGYVQGIVETFNIAKSELSKKEGIQKCSMNIYGFPPEFVAKLCARVKKFKETHKNDRKAEALLPVEITKMIEDKEISMKIYPTDDSWFGITNPGDEEIVRKAILNI